MKYLLALLCLLSLNSVEAIELRLEINGSLLQEESYLCPIEEPNFKHVNDTFQHTIEMNSRQVKLFSYRSGARYIWFSKTLSESDFRVGRNHFVVPPYRDSSIPSGTSLDKRLMIKKGSKTLGSCRSSIYNIPNYGKNTRALKCTFTLIAEQLYPGLERELRNRRNSIRDAITKYPGLNEQLSQKLEAVESLLERLKELDISDISEDDLKVFEEAQNLLRNAKKEISQLEADIPQKEEDIARDLESLADNVQSKLTEAGIDESILDEQELFDVEEIGLPEVEEEFDEESSIYRAVADGLIETLIDTWEAGERIHYLQIVSAWQLEYETLKIFAETEAEASPNAYQSFLVNSERVNTHIRQVLDRDGFFLDSGITPDAKEVIDRKIKAVSPPLAAKIKRAINLHPSSVKKNAVIVDVTELGEMLSEVDDTNWLMSLLYSAGDVLEALPTVMLDTVTCIGKNVIAGPIYPDYYEVRHQKSYCDDTPLDDWEVAVSASSLAITSVSYGATTPIGGAVVDKASKFAKVTYKSARKVYKSVRAAKATRLGEKILESATKAFNAGGQTIGFAKGTGIVAFANKSRSQHAARHLTEAGILPNWNNSTFEKFKEIGVNIVENPLKSFDHKLGQTAVRGFHGKVDGKDVVMFIYKEGKYATQVATSVVPTPQQVINWGLK